MRGVLAGSLGCCRDLLDLIAHGAHGILKMLELRQEGGQGSQSRVLIGKSQLGDGLGRIDVIVERLVDLGNGMLKGRRKRKSLVGSDAAAEQVNMLGKILSDRVLLIGLLLLGRLQSRQHISPEGIMHHVGFKMMTQRRRGDRVVVHPGGQGIAAPQATQG